MPDTDRRRLLKIKVKSLAAEARIIKHEEHKLPGLARGPLTEHRKNVVRRACRNTHLAYGFLRGRTREQIETRCHDLPNYREVRRMVEQYGPKDGTLGERFDLWWGGHRKDQR